MDQIPQPSSAKNANPIRNRHIIGIKTGMLKAIAELKGVSQNMNDLEDFEECFKKWHTHILITKIKYNRHHKTNYVFIEPLGVFNNLPNFARRLYNEIAWPLKVKRWEEEKDIKLDCFIICFGEYLSVDVKFEGNEFVLNCSFVSANQEQEESVPDGFKYDIPILR